MLPAPVRVWSNSRNRALLGQISISIIAIVVSSVVLRGYEKQAYATAAVVYSLGVVADVWRVIEW